MTDLAKANLRDVAQYQDYECFALDCTTSATQEKFDVDGVRFRFETHYLHSWWEGISYLIRKDSNFRFYTPHNLPVEENDRILFHPKCKFPKSILRTGKSYTSKSPDLPTRVAVPLNFPLCSIRATRSEIVLMINENTKTLLLIDSNTYGNDVGGTEEQWKHSLQMSRELYSDIEDLEHFELVDGTNLYTCIWGLTDLDYAILTEMIPKDIVVREDILEVGADELSVDDLLSCFSLMQSSDDNIVETAFQMLAHHKFNNRTGIIYWMIRNFGAEDLAFRYKQKSSAFSWLMRVVYDRHNHCTNTPKLRGIGEREAAKQIVTRLSNGGISWNDQDEMVVTDFSWAGSNSNLRLLKAI